MSQGKMNTNSLTGGNSFHFNSDRKYFVKWQRHLEAEFQKSSHRESLQELLFGPQYPVDAATGLEVYPDKFVKKLIPPGPPNNATPHVKRAYYEEVNFFKSHNESVDQIFSTANQILQDSVNDALRQVVVSMRDPRVAYKHLERLYGLTSRTEVDKGNAFWDIFRLKMTHTHELDTFLQVEFGNALAAVTFDLNSFKRMVLLSTRQTNPFGFQLLEDRFVPTILKLQRENKSYADCLVELHNINQHHKSVGLNAVRSVNKVQKRYDMEDEELELGNKQMKCNNCSNVGHMSTACCAPFCGFCKQFDAGHKWHNCPKRLNRSNGKSNDKPKKRGWSNRDAESEYEEEDDEDTESEASTSQPRAKRKNSPSVKGKGEKASKDKNNGERKKVTVQRPQGERKKSRKYAQVKRGRDVNGRYCYSTMTSVREMTFPCCLDSGADDHIVNDIELLEKIHPNAKVPVMYTATGQKMKAEAVGKINKFMTQAIYSPDALDNLSSVSQLQKKGIWVIFPPKDKASTSDIPEEVGAFMVNGDGKILSVADKNMMFDIADFGKVKSAYSIELPVISKIDEDDEEYHEGDDDDSMSVEELMDYEGDDSGYESEKEYLHPKFANRVHTSYGLPKGITVEDRVVFTHNIGHWSKSQMIAMAEGSCLNYLCSVEQVKKFFPCQCVTCIKGQLKKRSISQLNEKLTEDPVESNGKAKKGSDVVKDPQVYDLFKNRRLEPVNMQIGAQVGIDFFGPILQASTLTATDKASGYMCTVPVTKDGKKETGFLLQKIIDHFALHGHHVKEFNKPIAELRCDSDKLFLSRDVDKLMRENGIKVVASPPDVHELNGLAENTNQKILNKCRMAFTQMRHCPEVLWPLCWEYQVQLFNLCSCPMEGRTHMTRQEAFTGVKPDFATTPYLPFGTVIEFPISTRKSKFAEKTNTGLFVGLSKEVAGAILIYSMVTKRVVARVTYRVLFYVPDPWKQLSPKIFTFDKLSKEELEELKKETVADEVVLGKEEVSNRLEAKYIPVTTALPTMPSDTIVSPSSLPVQTTMVEPAAVSTVQASVAPNAALPTTILMLTAPPPVVPPVEDVVPNVVIGHEGDKVDQNVPTVTVVPQTVVPAAVVPPAAAETSAPNVAAQSTAAQAKRARKKAKDKKKGKARVLVQPLLNASCKEVLRDLVVDGVTLSSDEDLHFQFMRNCGKMVFPMVRINGKRVKLEYTPAKQKKRCEQKLMRFIRRTIKKKRSKDSPTLAEAKKRKDWPKFLEAIELELEQLKTEGVFGDEIKSKDIVKLGIKVIGSMMVLTVKRKPDGTIDKYKARLVALGNQQNANQYDAISSPTARSATVKCLIAIQAKTGAKSCVMDVKGAYLKSHCKDEDLYLRVMDKIYKLRKYLYGLKQAGRKWNELLAETLSKLGYRQSNYDPSLFYLHRENGEFVYMCIHVDDFYVVSSHQALIDDLHRQLEEAFGEVTIKSDAILAYLGMQVKEEESYISLSQPGYLKKILEKAAIGDAMSDIPYSDSVPAEGDDDQAYDKTSYLELIGMLNYIAVLTRPDILYALSRCAQRCSQPTVRDYHRVLKVFKYLNKTQDFELRFKKGGEIKLVGYVDASHIHYAEDSKGHFGYAFSLGEDDACFYARSQKMKIITPAGSTETEYVALYEAATEVVFLRNLLDEIGLTQDAPTVLYEDNKSTIHMVHGDGKFHKQKHINVKYHYTKDLVKREVIDVQYCPTGEMKADILTKAATRPVQEKLAAAMLGMT